MYWLLLFWTGYYTTLMWYISVARSTGYVTD